MSETRHYCDCIKFGPLVLRGAVAAQGSLGSIMLEGR